MNDKTKFIFECLGKDDDLEFWRVACETLLSKPLKIVGEKLEPWPIFLLIGCCSRWLSSEPRRFSDTHGVPLPSDSRKESYHRLVMPDYDWSVLYYYDEGTESWSFGRQPQTSHYVYRIAIPAKTKNLVHATVLTHWEPIHPVNPKFSDFPQLYTFRKVDDRWEQVLRNNSIS